MIVARAAVIVAAVLKTRALEGLARLDSTARLEGSTKTCQFCFYVAALAGVIKMN